MTTCKILVVTGGVMSGIGKGVVTASLGSLLLANDISASAMKLDGYLNQDAGTLNPFRHGETYVLADGMECDLDLGTYERFMGVKLTRDNYYTAGRIYHEIFEREREGYYLGEDVQVVPHVSSYIKEIIRGTWEKTVGDDRGGILLVEVGGTIGDIENHLFIQALSELQNDEDVILRTIHVVPVLASNKGELKTKPAQQSIATLRQWGLTPDFVVCRLPKDDTFVPESVKEKFLIQSKIAKSRVFSSGELSSIYMLPYLLQKEGILEELYGELGEPDSLLRRSPFFENVVTKLPSLTRTVKIALVGKYASLQDSYLSVIESIRHAGYLNDVNVEFVFVNCRDTNSDEVNPLINSVDGLVVPGGYGADGVYGIMRHIRYARVLDLPFLGLCFGFQLAAIEYAQNVLGLHGCTSQEFDPDATQSIIVEMPAYNVARKGRTQRLGEHLVCRGSDEETTPLTREIFRDTLFPERFRHRFVFNSNYRGLFTRGGMRFPLCVSGSNEVLALELPTHPFFLGVQFHPEFNFHDEQPHRIFTHFITAARRTRYDRSS